MGERQRNNNKNKRQEGHILNNCEAYCSGGGGCADSYAERA